MSDPIDSALNRMIDAAVRCVKCGQPMGCGCWTKCPSCSWSFETGKACRNPNCPSKKKRKRKTHRKA